MALENGESVKLSGFAIFNSATSHSRPGRNPKTGEEIPITARRVVTFHASQKLKALVEAAHGNGQSTLDDTATTDQRRVAFRDSGKRYFTSAR